ncbi:hydrophobin [Trichoderma virens Gv29-8]|uniref:Hydrophobin n=2 Tax=Hypocrea virens TaxID=29875 RepID=A7LNX2_HYPVI
MQFSAIIALFASLAIAAPAGETTTHELAARDGPCSSGVTNNVPKCCGTGVLDLLYLDCKTPTQATSVLNPLSAVCGRVGLQAKCCTAGIGSVGVLCQDALPE